MQESDDLALSVVEDLDPSPAAKETMLRKADLLLGLALLVAVIGWSGWQWWRQQSLQEHYRAALTAADRHDWDGAHAHYIAASEYRDAAARASEAARLIAERDRHYKAAVAHAEGQEWADVLHDLQAVERIQPGYLDTASIAGQAETQVYRSALNGGIFLRTEVQHPGLYWRAGDAWVWLEKSDRWSSVRGASAGPTGLVLYDIPGEGWKPGGPTPPPAGAHAPGDVLAGYFPTPGSPELAGRELVLASLRAGGSDFYPLDLDPAQYDSYVVGERGMWALRYDMLRVLARRGEPYEQYAQPEGVGGLDRFKLTYYAFDRSPASDVALPDRNWAVLDLSHDGERLLLAEVDAPLEVTGTSRLYVAGPDGGSLRLLYTHQGGFADARFGPDDRYALVNAYSHISSRPMRGGSLSMSGGNLFASAALGPLGHYRNEKQAAILLSVEGGKPPSPGGISYVLAEGVKEAPSEEPLPAIKAVFVSQGPFAGKVALVQVDPRGDKSTVTLLDPARPETPLHKAVVRGRPVGSVWASGQSAEDGVVVAWEHGFTWASPNRDSLSVLQLAAGGSAQQVNVPLEPGEQLWDVQARAGYLLYTTERSVRRTRNTTAFELRTVPLSTPDGGARSNSLHRAEVSGELIPPFALPWHLGSDMIAYADSGVSGAPAQWGLHARTYSGAIAVSLERGIAAVYSLGSHPSVEWPR